MDEDNQQLDAAAERVWGPDGLHSAAWPYFDRDARPILISEWCRRSGQLDYGRVGDDRVGDYRVLTSWLGVDCMHAPSEPPLLYTTTMYYGQCIMLPYVQRYATLLQAYRGHTMTCRQIRDAEKRVSREHPLQKVAR